VTFDARVATPVWIGLTKEESNKIPCKTKTRSPRGGGLVFEAHILVYHSTLGSRVMKKMRQEKDLFYLEDEFGQFGPS
jgi:hypothetical protein